MTATIGDVDLDRPGQLAALVRVRRPGTVRPYSGPRWERIAALAAQAATETAAAEGLATVDRVTFAREAAADGIGTREAAAKLGLSLDTFRKYLKRDHDPKMARATGQPCTEGRDAWEALRANDPRPPGPAANRERSAEQERRRRRRRDSQNAGKRASRARARAAAQVAA